MFAEYMSHYFLQVPTQLVHGLIIGMLYWFILVLILDLIRKLYLRLFKKENTLDIFGE